jgi:hypothetical protein
MRMQSTDQLASSLEALTGFRWRYGGADMLGLDTVGYRLLAGGVDGMTVVQPPQDPSVTWALAIERLAQAASYAAVQQDFGGEPPPVLLTGVTRDTVPGDLAFEAQLRELHWRLYAVRADDAFLEEATALWSESLASEGDPRAAWMVLLSAMLRDPLWVGT